MQPSQKLMCCSNSVASSEGSARSRYSVTSSTTSWQVMCSPIQVLLQRGAHARAGAVQEHALVAAGDVERGADLLGREAGDVAQRDHLLLRGRQARDDLYHERERLAAEQRLLGQRLPVRRVLLPVPGKRVVAAAEAVGVDRRLVALGRERGERHAGASRAPRV